MQDFPLTRQLQGILGEVAFVHFCQALGGTRVYVPHSLRDENEIVQDVGRDAAEKLSRALAPATIRVPLARRERALYFRSQGLSNPQVARRLGITETGVEKLFDREADLPDRPGRCRNDAQLKLL